MSGDHRRRFGRMRALAALAVAMARIPPWLASAKRDRRRHEQAFFANIASGFGISVECCGIVSRQPGTLFIMNHISWADIAVMLTIIDADFVARADMQRWPVIGALARRFGPIFVDRRQPSGSRQQVDAIRARLQAGRSVILCAEGTTSDGTSILPFRTSLFAAADAAQVVQPLLLSYLNPDGSPLSPRRQREVAWIDDDDLLSGAARVAREHTLARVTFLPPVAVQGDRKLLADTVREHMLAVHAAAPNRPR